MVLSSVRLPGATQFGTTTARFPSARAKRAVRGKPSKDLISPLQGTSMRSHSSTAAAASVLRPGGVSISTTSHSAVRARAIPPLSPSRSQIRQGEAAGFPAALAPCGRVLLGVHVHHKHGEASLPRENAKAPGKHGFALPSPVNGHGNDFCAHVRNTTIATVHNRTIAGVPCCTNSGFDA